MKRLTLKREQLAELGNDELRQAVGAAAGDSFTGRVNCVLSLEDPCVSSICLKTKVCTVS